jgi:hypothetical protein
MKEIKSECGENKKRSYDPPAIMIWGGISMRGETPLYLGSGSVNSAKYVSILNECLLPTMEALYLDGFTLQQDNARPHTAKDTKDWMVEQGFRL